MSLSGAFLRTVLMVLLLANSFCKRGCNYQEILVTFRGVIFVELQNLNLTDPIDRSREGDHCPSRKAHRILISIYNMTRKMRCQRIGKHQADFMKPIEDMELLISHHCPKILRNDTPCPIAQNTGRKKRRRARLTQVTRALITCWQKLQAALSKMF